MAVGVAFALLPFQNFERPLRVADRLPRQLHLPLAHFRRYGCVRQCPQLGQLLVCLCAGIGRCATQLGQHLPVEGLTLGQETIAF
ncbi:hypothetical protein A5684_06145 [Mycobacterium intracellulare]|nr:hypothetical protein A5684_06145 [Mycobacterium intracellulare]